MSDSIVRLNRRQQRRNKLAVANLGLVGKALQCMGRPNDPDLFQEGALGLLRAAARFDPHRGYRFSTFATAAIRNAVKDALAREGVIRSPKGKPRVQVVPLTDI